MTPPSSFYLYNLLSNSASKSTISTKFVLFSSIIFQCVYVELKKQYKSNLFSNPAKLRLSTRIKKVLFWTTFYQFYIKLLRIESTMKHPDHEGPECSPITPAKILEDLLRESQRQDPESSIINKLMFTQNDVDTREEQLVRDIEGKKKRIKEMQEKLVEVRTNILKINKYHDSYIELHDDRRSIQKDILDDEFDVIKLQRELDIIRRNRSAVCIVEEEQTEMNDSGHPQKEESPTATIKQASEEEEESVRISQIKKVESSVIRFDIKHLFDEELATSTMKEDNPQKKVPSMKKYKTSTGQKKKVKGPSYKESKEVPLTSSILFTPKYYDKSPVLKSYQSQKKLKTFSRLSSDELYRSQLQMSLTYDRMALNYINSRYLY